MFSYAAESSIKGPAENDTVLLMLEEILTDGFMTANEPLLLIQSETLAKGHPEARCQIHEKEKLFTSASSHESQSPVLLPSQSYFKGPMFSMC